MGACLLIVLILPAACANAPTSTSPTAANTTAADENAPNYLDFNDVLIPHELKIDKKASSVIKTPYFSAGILCLKGRVEIQSLMDFFETNMTKDNWRLVSSYKATRSIMIFEKQTRWCVIDMDDSQINTYVQISLLPQNIEQPAATK
jgi:hypothetical protein